MMTVHEVSGLTGVSIRALHHYDRIGLLPATRVTEAGYRLYDDTALERLQQILLFRELEFPLNDIREILDSPTFDRSKAIAQQIRLLELKKEHLQDLIDLARGIQTTGVNTMSFEAFDKKKLDEYAKEAREAWGETKEYKEFEKKDSARTDRERGDVNARMMELFREFGRMKDLSPDSDEAIAQAKKLQDFITANFYHCTDEILCGLGDMYAAGGEFTANIDAAGGEGTAVFACRAIHAYAARK